MNTRTYGEVVFNKGHFFTSVDKDSREIVTSFTSSDRLMNAAHVRMSAKEAREFAQLLIVHAQQLDPISE